MEDPNNTDSESETGSYIQKTPIMTSLMQHKVYKATRKPHHVETNPTHYIQDRLPENPKEDIDGALDLRCSTEASGGGSIEAIALNLSSQNETDDASIMGTLDTDDCIDQKGRVEDATNMSTEINCSHSHRIKEEPVEHEQYNKSLCREGSLDPLIQRNQELYYPCLHCYKSFSKIDSLKRHVRIHADTVAMAMRGADKVLHLRTQSAQLVSSEHDKSELSDEGKKLYFPCMYCEKSFSRKDSRKRHEKLHADDTRTFDVIKETSVLHKDDNVNDRPNQGECSLSDVKIEIDRGSTKMDDNDVNEAASQDDGIDVLYPCMYCQKGFKRKDSRKRHERIHTKEKPHKCSYCGKTFITKCHAREHESVHTGIKDYVCSICHKGFATSERRNRHEKTHVYEVVVSTPPEGTKSEENVPLVNSDNPYVENVPNVNKPDQIEIDGCTLFTCRYCPKTFPRVDSRKRHERTHTGFKPHTCQFCGHSFITAYHKTLHERTHTKEKPHVCTFCYKGFSRMDSLRRHEKVHSSIIDGLSGLEKLHGSSMDS